MTSRRLVVLVALAAASLTAGCGGRTGLHAPAASCEVVDAGESPRGSSPSDVGALSCATDAVPDLTFATWMAACPGAPECGFDVDTGFAVGDALGGGIGAGYGKPACPAQLLIEVSLEGLSDYGVGIFGGWSILSDAAGVTARECAGYASTVTLWGFDGQWTQFDQIVYGGEPSLDSMGDPECIPLVTSSVQGESGDMTAPVPSARFAKLRAAVVTTDCDRLIPVFLAVAASPNGP